MSKEINLNKNTMIVSETDEKGVIVYANDDFCDIAGYKKEELIGQSHIIHQKLKMGSYDTFL